MLRVVSPDAGSRVLIVEDDAAVRGFLTQALLSGGYAPVAVRTGEEALDVARTEAIAVTLIDGILPDMHGVRLAEAMLETPNGGATAICFVTGAIRESVAVSAGVGALSKPLRLAELLSAIDVLMRWRDSGGSPIEERRDAVRRLEQGFLVGP
ncbi:MAG: response regulator [Candidatus Dormibacteria bacterium]